jgi:hypothetical protein
MPTRESARSRSRGRLLCRTVLAAGLLLASAGEIGAAGKKVDAARYAALQERIRSTPVESFNLDFFKSVYQEFAGSGDTAGAPEMLKTILGEGGHDIPEKSKRLGELRKYYDWSIQAEYARDRNVIVENTNQGKDNGGRSDLDATGNVLELDAAGEARLRDQAVRDLQRYHDQRYRADGFRNGSETVDVSLFNGDAWLPDFRDVRLGYGEFNHRLIRNVLQIRSQPGAYYVPGAHKEQAHDRALAEGHSIHIGWDFVNNMPSVNGVPIIFDAETGRVMQLEVDAETGRIREPRRAVPLVEYTTREASRSGGVVKRYEGISELHGPDKWRRSFGNLVQNWYEMLTHGEPISRNKYFIERIVDQAINRVANVNGTYVEIARSGADAATQEAWKRSFIEKAFGVRAGSAEFAEIRSVLDRAAQIQIDYKAERSYNDNATRYYAEEIAELRREAAGRGADAAPASEAEILKKAEARFAAKQRRITIEGGLKVIEHTFKMEFTPEGLRRATHDFASPDVARKVMAERGIELALFFDMLESAPLEAAERQRLRERVVEAIPSEARSLALRMAELAGLKMDLIGRRHIQEIIRGERSHVLPSQIFAEAEAEIRRLLGNVETAPRANRGDLLRYLDRAILTSLGPVHAAEYAKAVEASNLGVQAKFAGVAYWNEIKSSADMMWGTMAALSMVNAYQQHCADQISWNEECLGAMGQEGFYQVLFLMPFINTGLILKDGMEALGRGDLGHGAVGVGLGLASIPMIAEGIGVGGAVAIKAYILYITAQLGVAVTYGYAVQLMESDFTEQAFKAQPEPGKQARPYEYRSRPSILRADTPTYPLLSDVIPVEADAWSAERRARAASGLFSADIQADLLEMGVDPGSPEWDRRHREVAGEYGQLLPYTQRMAGIFETFSPRVEAKLAELRAGDPDLAQDFIGVEVCMETKGESIETRYAEPPGLWDRMRFWADRGREMQIEYSTAFGDCVAQSVGEDEVFLRPTFEAYVDGWIAGQSFGYRSLTVTDARRRAMVDALMNEYVVHRHLNEQKEQQAVLEQAAERGRAAAETREQVLSALLAAQGEAEERVAQVFVSRAGGSARGAFEVEPEVVIETPAIAVRLGMEAQVDFEARGRYWSAGDGKPSGANDWQASLSSEIVGVELREPENLLRDEALEEELAAGAGAESKRFVSIEEKLSGELKEASGSVLATAEGVVTHWDLLEWSGSISVEVRAAGPETTDLEDVSQTSPYPGARVALSGAASAEGVSEMGDAWAGTAFDELPAGSYSVRVEPAEGDERQEGAEGEAELVDFTVSLGESPSEDDEREALTVRRDDPANPDARLVLVTWKDRDSITVVLPFRPEEEAEEAAEESAEDESVVEGGDVDLSDLLERMRVAGARAQGEAEGARTGCGDAEGAAERVRRATQTVSGGLGAVGAEIDGLAARAGGLDELLNRARSAAAAAFAAAQRLAALRDEAAALRDQVCANADLIATATTMVERERLLGQVQSSLARMRALGGQAAAQIEVIRRSVEEARAARGEAQVLVSALEAVATALSEQSRPLEEAIADASLAEESIEGSEAAIGEVEAQRTVGNGLLGEAASRLAEGGESAASTALLAEMQGLAAGIEEAHGGAVGCPPAARAVVEPAAEALAAARRQESDLAARLAQIRATLEGGGRLSQLDAALAEAEATLGVTEAFEESLQNRLDDALLCAEVAEGSMLNPLPGDAGGWGGESGREGTDGGWTSAGGVETEGGGGDAPGPAVPVTPPSDPVVDDLIAQAVDAFNRCDFTTAKAIADRIAARAPGHPWLAANYAKIIDNERRQRAALAALRRAEAILSRPGAGWEEIAAARAAANEAAGVAPFCLVDQVTTLVTAIDEHGERVRVAEAVEREREREAARTSFADGLGTLITAIGTVATSIAGGAPPPSVPVGGAGTGGVGGTTADPCAYKWSYPSVYSPTPTCDCPGYTYRGVCVNTGGGGGGAAGAGGSTPVAGPVEDKIEGETRVSSRNVRVCVTDVNSVLDDQYDLYVNGGYVGSIAHPEGGATCYNAMLRGGPNRLELRLVATRGKSTYLLFSINDGEFSSSFSGSANHIWSVIAP